MQLPSIRVHLHSASRPSAAPVAGGFVVSGFQMIMASDLPKYSAIFLPRIIPDHPKPA
jgi:hypothetical protein